MVSMYLVKCLKLAYVFVFMLLTLFSLPVMSAESSVAVLASDEMLELPIEDLLNVKITSVSKKSQALSDAAAAVFVISQDDIKRSGVTSVPEALRMAPGVEVARVSSNKWAVSARGFNGSFANKLLVLMDGRSVYTPAFSGVYWDAQDVLLEDVERIEVIRGSGAALWGANAVNGVINIITQSASKTQGGLLVAGTGSKETGFGAFRYGTQLNEDTAMRAYVKGFERGSFATQTGSDSGDDWQKQQGGFRIDSHVSMVDDVTLQGDLYQNKNNQTLLMPTLVAPYTQQLSDTANASGGNLTTRWQHTVSLTEKYTLQAYYDHYQRDELFMGEVRDTLDVDFQHNVLLTERQDVIWGLDYRYSHDDMKGTAYSTIDPSSRNNQLFSAFVQDEVMLIDKRLWLTIGSKFEHNDYTGFEGQPTAKLMWEPQAGQRVWASVSRAVRTPSRLENDMNLHIRTFTTAVPGLPFQVPVALTLMGDRDYKAETLLSYELGYRINVVDTVSLDLTAFYNDYTHLRSTTRGTPSIVGTMPNGSIEQPTFFSNHSYGNTYGFEMATVWQMADWWRWDANYSFLDTHLYAYDVDQGASPQHKTSLRAGLTPVKNITLDFWLRYVGAATSINPIRGTEAHAISAYTALDIRLGWKPHSSLELSVTGQNLLDKYHLEYVDEFYTAPTAIPRAVYGKVVWTF